MKFYFHPVSTTSRPIMMFAADNGVKLDYQVIDVFKGEHLQEPFALINRNRRVPILQDGDFLLSESSSILKYLADKFKSPAYPTDLHQRAKVNEMMDWFNTGLYRDLGYGFIYQQFLPGYHQSDEKMQAKMVAAGRDRSKDWLKTLDQHMIGPDRAYLCGNEITIADYLGASMLTLGEVIRIDYSAYPNVMRWLGNMKARPNWAKVNEPFYTYFVQPYKDTPFEAL